MLNIDNERLVITVTEDLTEDDISQIASLSTYTVKAVGQLTQDLANTLSRVLTEETQVAITTTFSEGVMVVNSTSYQMQVLLPVVEDTTGTEVQ